MNVNNKHNKKNLTLILVFFLGIFLNQSGEVLGVNFSYSDIVLVLLLITLSFQKKLRIPKIPTLFFIILLITTTTTSAIFMGSKYNVVIELNDIITETIKLITLFGYLIIGYSLVKNEEYKLLFKSYSYFTILISVIGIMTLFINVGSYRSILFFGTNRFRGLMNDPNYFSILQLLGLSIIVNDENIKTPRKSIYILLIIFSIMMSNSKTGFLSLIILGVILITNRVTKLEKHKRVYIVLSLPVIFLLGYVFRNEIVYLIADLPAKYIPGYNRVAVLIKDFQKGVSGGGSARDRTISNALTLWKENPLFGVGIGSYSKIGKIYLGSGSIAHNTYLQLLVEWGTIIATIFLGFIASLIIKTRKSDLGKYLIFLLIPLLLGSLSISLNNARIFWILLGMLLYLYNNRSNESFNSIRE